MYNNMSSCFLKTNRRFSNRTNPFFLKKAVQRKHFQRKKQNVISNCLPDLIFSTANHLFGYIVLKILFFTPSVFLQKQTPFGGIRKAFLFKI